MFNFAYRNLMLFFRDKTTVFLSFLAEFIIIGLYLLFIRSNLIDSFPQIKNPEHLMDIWMTAGIMGITSVSVSMSSYGIMVADRAQNIRKDFIVAPIRNTSILGGYLSSAVFIGYFMTFFLFLIAEVYLYHQYGIRPGADRILVIYGILFLTTVSNASLSLLLVSFLKTSNSLASCCTILGSLIGFLTGIYLPMGALPESVQFLIKCFPVSHGVILFRQALLEPFISDTFGNLSCKSAQEFMKYMGTYLYIEGIPIPAKNSVYFLLLTTLLSLLISFWSFSKKEK